MSVTDSGDPMVYKSGLYTFKDSSEGNPFHFWIQSRRQAETGGSTRKLSDVIFNRFSIDLDMSHHEFSITSQRIELRNSWSELPSGLPLSFSEFCLPRNPHVNPNHTQRLTSDFKSRTWITESLHKSIHFSESQSANPYSDDFGLSEVTQEKWMLLYD